MTPGTEAPSPSPQAPLSWNSPGENTRVGSHSSLQGIFLTKGLNLGLPCCRQILYCLNHQGSPRSQYAFKTSSTTYITYAFCVLTSPFVKWGCLILCRHVRRNNWSNIPPICEQCVVHCKISINTNCCYMTTKNVSESCSLQIVWDYVSSTKSNVHVYTGIICYYLKPPFIFCQPSLWYLPMCWVAVSAIAEFLLGIC